MKKVERQLRKLKVAADFSSVEVGFVELPEGTKEKEKDEEEGEDEEDDSPAPNLTEFFVKAAHRPHGDLIAALKKLRKHGLDLFEVTVDSKEVSNWNVLEFSIAGDYLMKQSRVVLTLSHHIKLTKKTVNIKLPQVTMYPTAEDAVKYHAADKLTAVIEEVINEVWLYLYTAKYDEKGQLPLFQGSTLKKVA